MEREKKTATGTLKKLHRMVFVFVIIIGLLCLFGCDANNSAKTQKTPVGVTTAPSGETVPTEEALPTATQTPTPTPTLEPKTCKQVEEDLKSIKVSIDDLMNEDVVYPTVFGAVDDNLTNEILKRTAYFESFGIMNFNEAKASVVKLSYCYLNSDAVDKEKAQDYLSILNEYDGSEIERIYIAMIEYNAKHPDNQIVIGWGAIGNALGENGRAVINDRQQEITKLLIDKKPFYDEFISDGNYDVTVIESNGSKVQLTGSYDDLSIAAKYADLLIQCISNLYLTDILGYSDSLYDARSYIAEHIDSIIPAFRDPEHANVRRHGFDATDYYEEDLDRDNP